MKILDPTSILLDEETLHLLDELKHLYADLNELRTRAGASLGKEAEENFDLVVDAVHYSSAIEGLATEVRETRRQIEAMAAALSEKKAMTANEVQSLYKALLLVASWVGADVRPSPGHIRLMHGALKGGAPGPTMNLAGEWRSENNLIHGSQWMTPDLSEVPGLMLEFGARMDRAFDQVDPVVLAAWAHHTLVQIHPFMDGNGRIARLLQDHILWVRRYAPAVLRSEQKSQYYAALEEADQGRFGQLVRLLARACEDTCRQLDRGYRKHLSRADWARRLAERAEEKALPGQEKQYRVWRTRMEDIRSAFEAGGEALGASDLPVRVTFRPYPILEFDSWRSLLARGREAGNWFFTIGFDRHPDMHVYVFSFGRHFVEPSDPPEDRAGRIPSLMIGRKRLGESEWSRLEYKETTFDPPRLRRIYFNGASLCARLLEEGTSEWRRLANCEPDDLARGFYEDILRGVFGIPL